MRSFAYMRTLMTSAILVTAAVGIRPALGRSARQPPEAPPAARTSTPSGPSGSAGAARPDRVGGSTRPTEPGSADDLRDDVRDDIRDGVRDGVRIERKPAFLTAGDIAGEVTPYARDLQRCYRELRSDAPRARHVSLTLVIAPDGHLRSLEARSPSLAAKTTRKIAACAHAVLEPVRFPARRNETVAVVPYYFQKTEAPNAGPQLSCWSPKGC